MPFPLSYEVQLSGPTTRDVQEVVKHVARELRFLKPAWVTVDGKVVRFATGMGGLAKRDLSLLAGVQGGTVRVKERRGTTRLQASIRYRALALLCTLLSLGGGFPLLWFQAGKGAVKALGFSLAMWGGVMGGNYVISTLRFKHWLKGIAGLPSVGPTPKPFQ